MAEAQRIPDPPGEARRPPRNQAANLQSFFDALAARSTFEWSFLHDRYRDHAAWREQVWPWVMDRLCWDPGPLDLRPEVMSRETGEGYVMEKVAFSSHALDGRRRPPSGWPAILALHDMGGLRTYGKEKMIRRPRESAGLTAHRQQYYEGRSVAIDLARKGYAVLATDAFLFGERAFWPDGEIEEFLRRRDAFSEEEDREANSRINRGRGTAEHHLNFLGGSMPGLPGLEAGGGRRADRLRGAVVRSLPGELPRRPGPPDAGGRFRLLDVHVGVDRGV
jgi:hypothetical protein